jgi:outer membrane receptor protein involved in Fe transport
MGNHTIRLGFSWLHDTVTDLGFGENTQGALTVASLQEFYNGGGPNSLLTQNFPTATEQPFAFNTFGGYIADDWKVNSNLMLSLNLRMENYANPTCGHNCFSRLAAPFTGAGANANTPYNQAIVCNQHDAFPNTPT